MGISVIPAPAGSSKTRKVEMLTSGSSWTVPADVTYVNVTLVGGGGGGGGTVGLANNTAGFGNGGEVRKSSLAVTPAASISYGIGAGGTAGSASPGGQGGTTTFTGATSATGGLGGRRGGGADGVGQAGQISTVNNFGAGGGTDNTTPRDGGAGASGWIEIEYWV